MLEFGLVAIQVLVPVICLLIFSTIYLLARYIVVERNERRAYDRLLYVVFSRCDTLKGNVIRRRSEIHVPGSVGP